nr:polyprotein [Picornaviridae sp.]
MFSQGSVIATICARIYYAPFINHVAQHRIENECVIGMNPFSYEYTVCCKKLLEVGEAHLDTFITSDVDRWDGSMLVDVMMATNEVIKNIYKINNINIDKQLDILLQYEMFSYHIATINKEESYVYQCYGGEPSGWLMTLTRNCLVNMMYNRIAWMTVVPKPLNTMYNYSLNVRALFCGDDNITNVTQPFSQFFNSYNISQCMLEYGIKLVNAEDKNLDCRNNIFINTTFLKLRPAFDKRRVGTFLPLLDIHTIYDMTNWRKKQFSDEEMLTINSNTMLRIIYFYGKDLFTQCRNKLKQTLPTMHLLTYTELDEAYYLFDNVIFDNTATRTQNNSYLFSEDKVNFLCDYYSYNSSVDNLNQIMAQSNETAKTTDTKETKTISTPEVEKKDPAKVGAESTPEVKQEEVKPTVKPTKVKSKAATHFKPKPDKPAVQKAKIDPNVLWADAITLGPYKDMYTGDPKTLQFGETTMSQHQK